MSPAPRSATTRKLDKNPGYQLVEEVEHLGGVTYQLRLVNCGNRRCKRCLRGPTHGPYWYAFWKRAGRTGCRYVGMKLPPAVRRDVAG